MISNVFFKLKAPHKSNEKTQHLKSQQKLKLNLFESKLCRLRYQNK